ncbi:MAG TPA: GNAT family N-acetyltransferase [Candidatus Saccharimonadales bacterium]|nr:GNAT family N-acetyltransferase [Candidatus Saccharimonadales bacterium]
MPPTVRLRPMTSADVDPVSAAILADDWGDRRSWFEFAVGHPRCTVLCATDDDGTVIGTGVATHNGPVAWIGTIWVAAVHRGAGLGRALTEAAIEAAEAAGARSLLLVATSAGRPLYERLGFTEEARYVILERAGGASSDEVTEADATGHSTRIVRAYRPGDLPALATLDAVATGEDRAHLLTAFAAPGTTRVVVDASDRPTGFLVRPPWGGGATIAVDADDALALLEARRRTTPPERHVRCGVVASNERALERLTRDGWTEAWTTPRLLRGDPIDWHPAQVYGQFNFALG